jgi:hypothetical protein
MGVHLSVAPHLLSLMNSDDRARYGGATAQTESSIRDDTSNRSHKRDAAERKEQGTFASWLLLQNSNGRRIPFVWHATHKPSKATPGTPDFFVGINGHALWIEFKRDASCKLTPEQEEFALACEAQRIEHHVVYNAVDAIELVQRADSWDDRAFGNIRTASPHPDGRGAATRGCGA